MSLGMLPVVLEQFILIGFKVVINKSVSKLSKDRGGGGSSDPSAHAVLWKYNIIHNFLNYFIIALFTIEGHF